jgi:DNA-binding CsgD family transcriptional regulator
MMADGSDIAWERLTQRQMEVLRTVCAVRDTHEASRRLGISSRVVSNTLRDIKDKLAWDGATTRQWCYRLGKHEGRRV